LRRRAPHKGAYDEVLGIAEPTPSPAPRAAAMTGAAVLDIGKAAPDARLFCSASPSQDLSR
jgi:hypothetical protein